MALTESHHPVPAFCRGSKGVAGLAARFIDLALHPGQGRIEEIVLVHIIEDSVVRGHADWRGTVRFL